jgi:O-antigen ligase
MVITNFKTQAHVKVGVALILIAAGIMAVWGTVQHFSDPLWRVPGPLERGGANVLGGFFLITIFLTLHFLLNYRLTNLRLGLFILLVITICTLMFTRSRSSYASLYIGFVFYSILSRRYYLLAIPILLIIFMPFILPKPVQETAYSIEGVWSKKKTNPSWEARVGAWTSDALPKVIKRPFLGYGLGSHDLAWVDNQYVLDALSMGLIGLAVFIWLLSRIFRSVWRMYRESSEVYNKILAFGYICGLVALLIQGVAITNFYTIRTMVPFWFLTGLVMVTRNIELERQARLAGMIEGLETT